MDTDQIRGEAPAPAKKGGAFSPWARRRLAPLQLPSRLLTTHAAWKGADASAARHRSRRQKPQATRRREPRRTAVSKEEEDGGGGITWTRLAPGNKSGHKL